MVVKECKEVIMGNHRRMGWVNCGGKGGILVGAICLYIGLAALAAEVSPEWHFHKL